MFIEGIRDLKNTLDFISFYLRRQKPMKAYAMQGGAFVRPNTALPIGYS
jgi:hypothetical protein